MDRRDLNNTHFRGQQHILRNLTNISGKKKRPLCLDSEMSNNKKKFTWYQASALSTRQDTNRESQFHRKGIVEVPPEIIEQFHPIKENAPPENHREIYDRKGKCIDNKENIRPRFRSRELSPEMEEDCKDDYEADNVDTLKCTRRTEIDLNRSTDFDDSNLDSFDRTETRLKFDGGGRPSSGPLSSEMGGLKEFSNPHAAPNSESIKRQRCINLVKSCTCSFCLKAAFMWTDLNFQDLKGRLAALKKSTGLTRKLLGSCYDHEPACRTTSESSQQSTDMDFQVKQHWRSLFLYMENTLDCEISNMESSLQRLSELREKCKRDLEMISKVSLV